MQVMPGMTQDQRKAAGNSYRQFQQRLFGNRPQSGGTMYAGGSKNFDERTGQYTQPPSAPVIGNAPNGRPVTGAYGSQPAPTKAPDMSAYGPQRPGRAQPIQPSYGSPYQPAPGYGGGYGPGGIRTMDFKDRDGDGVDDRDQAGPGMPAPGRGGAQMPPSQQPVYDRGPGGQMIAYPSPTPPQQPQAQLTPQDLATRQRLLDSHRKNPWMSPEALRELDDPEFYKKTAYAMPVGPSVPSAPSAPRMPAQPVPQPYGAPTRPRRGTQAPVSRQSPPSFSPPPAAGPDFGQMFNFQGFAPAPPPPRPPEIAPAQADWYGPPGSFNGQGERRRVTQDFDFDERRRIDARIQQQMQEQFPYRNPSDVPNGVRENITRQEQQFTEQLRRERFAQPNAERDAAVAAQEAEYQQRLQQRYGGPGFTQQSIGWDGSVMSPQQNIAQRDAFIARLNAERAPLAATAGVYQTGMAPVAPPLNRDFASMWGQAGNMVANGWTNPLAGLFG